MIDTPGLQFERRLLIVAPVGKDAALVASMLRRYGIDCVTCAGLEPMLAEMERGAAAILIAEEALRAGDDRLAKSIARQPPWSDLPVLLLTHRGADSSAVARALETLGNVTLIERPARVGALVSAVRSAMRARERQYQARAHLEEREQADRRKDQFLATLAHELRNPLAPIRNALYLLRLSHDGCRAPAANVTEMIERQCDHLVRLVDDLMEVSRITRGKVELRTEPTDLATVIESAVETSRPAIDGARHELTIALPPEPLVLHADRMRLAQVFSNLLHNAAKYSDPGAHIDVIARREGQSAVVTVRDTGIGINDEVLPRIFEMFVQADSRCSRAQGGLGIGLTLARSLVELHGGSICASSEGAGRGSAFTVRLPLANGKETGVTACLSAVRSLHGAPRILVVDDNRDAADSLGALLTMLGAEVRIAHDGRGALDLYATFRPVVTFLDLSMPGMDGYEVAQRIRERCDPNKTLLVALTGRGHERERSRTAAAGFDHHLVKPADIGALHAVLAAALH